MEGVALQIDEADFTPSERGNKGKKKERKWKEKTAFWGAKGNKNLSAPLAKALILLRWEIHGFPRFLEYQGLEAQFPSSATLTAAREGKNAETSRRIGARGLFVNVLFCRKMPGAAAGLDSKRIRAGFDAEEPPEIQTDQKKQKVDRAAHGA